MRLKYQDIARDGNGCLISSATVTAYLAGTTTLATIYTSSTSTSGVNSVTTGTDGSFTLYVDAADYALPYQTFKLVISKDGFTSTTIDNITINDVVLGTYTISTAKVYAYDIEIPQGVIFAKSGVGTLTFSKSFTAPQCQVFSGFTKGVDVTFTVSPLTVWDYWFDGSTNTGTVGIDTISERTSAAGVTIDGVKLKDSEPYCDVINEKTGAAGVTIDGVKLKDSQPYCDVINEKTATAGVTIDGCLIKDGVAAAATSATSATTATTSTQVTDGTNNIKTKIINIGDWNLDATDSVDIAHGLDVSKIRSVSALIRSDNGQLCYQCVGGPITTMAEVELSIASVTGTNVALIRKTGGTLDGNVSFDSTSYNRGWITIVYVE